LTIIHIGTYAHLDPIRKTVIIAVEGKVELTRRALWPLRSDLTSRSRLTTRALRPNRPLRTLRTLKATRALRTSDEVRNTIAVGVCGYIRVVIW
jgi:hypothetical protein